MINEKNFDLVKKELERNDKLKEELIKKSRNIVKLSKRIIYSLHRDDIKEAEKELQKIKMLVKKLKNYKYPKLIFSSPFKIAIQEYVEALSYYYLLKYNKILPYSKEFVDVEYYLLGLCDLVGELVRKAINFAINNKFDEAVFIRNAVDELYNKFLQLDLQNGELRKKSDSIKYELRKLDSLVFELKMRK